MGKIDEYASGRNDGLLLALKIVEEDGVDALREEIKFRGAKGINTAMSKKELNKACTKIKGMTLDTMLLFRSLHCMTNLILVRKGVNDL